MEGFRKTPSAGIRRWRQSTAKSPATDGETTATGIDLAAANLPRLNSSSANRCSLATFFPATAHPDTSFTISPDRPLSERVACQLKPEKEGDPAASRRVGLRLAELFVPLNIR